MSELLTVSDLEIAKKHDTFHSEVITGKAGGLSTGANIDTATNAVTGQTQKTLPKQLDDHENEFKLRMAQMAFVRVGTFAAGYSALTDMRQTLLASNGHEYGWSGAFPKTIAAGSTPETTGGIGAGGWVDRTDVMLRSEINVVVKRFASVADMVADTSLYVGQIVETIGYYNDWIATLDKPRGGNRYEIVTGGTGVPDGGSFITLSNGLQAKGLFVGDCVNISQFGAKGDGLNDDTTAIQSSLNKFKHVNISAGQTSLISTTITVPHHTKLEFEGGLGNSNGSYPSSYLIKKSSMNTWGLIISETGWVEGGGLICQTGNMGGGVQLLGNGAKLSNFLQHAAGGDGIRVGSDGVYKNTNSTELYHVTSQYSGGHGFYIHDGVSVGPADANAGTIYQCFSQYNGGDGFRLGHCFWVTMINCLAERNTGYGLNLSGIANGVGDVYPECRWATIIGGDFNEGNTAGQLTDQSYFATFINADKNNMPTTSGNGLQGSGIRCKVGGDVSQLSGLTVQNYPLTVSGGSSGSIKTDFVISSNSINNNGAGRSLLFKETYSTTPRSSGQISNYQVDVNKDAMGFSVNYNGVLQEFLKLNPNARNVTPFGDGSLNLGGASSRWSTIYAATGTINTSDEREKTFLEIEEAENNCAKELKNIIRKFKFNDSISIKGSEDARIHFGVGAQTVAATFEKYGLDPNKYALFCYDKWDGQDEIKDENGIIIQKSIPAGDRYGIRYDELAMFLLLAL